MTTARMKIVIGGLAIAAATAACGRQSALARPAPLFGAQAQADYQAEQAAAARAASRREAARRAGRGTAASTNTRSSGDPAATDSSSTDPSNRPPTTRDVQDPAQRLSPLSSSPAAGAPDPLGPPVSVTPPN